LQVQSLGKLKVHLANQKWTYTTNGHLSTKPEQDHIADGCLCSAESGSGFAE